MPVTVLMSATQPLIEALKFYGKVDNFVSPVFVAQDESRSSPIEKDRGERAREALKFQPRGFIEPARWQTIDNAPKDGQPVDLWCDGSRHVDCQWMVPKPVPSKWKDDEKTWCYYHAQWEDWVELSPSIPTHWMRVEPPA